MASAFQIASAAFNAGDAVPRHHTCDGEDISPPLQWSDPPEDVKSLALIVDDPDAPGKTFVHWVAYNIPPDYNGRILSEGENFGDSGTREGVNDFGNLGYGGPCPPAGREHTYSFRLYALDARLDLEAGATKKQVTQAMDGHVLAEANLSGSYRRA